MMTIPFRGDKITLQVIEELKTRHCQRGVDKNKEEEIRKRYDEATEKGRKTQEPGRMK